MPRKKIISIILLGFSLLSAPLITRPAFSATQAVECFCEFGITFYRRGRFDEALREFNKALILDPANKTAKKYINSIFQRETLSISRQRKPVPPKITKESDKRVTREEAMDNAFANLGKKEGLLKKPAVRINGQIQLSAGFTPKDTIWKQANGNLNEENWRSLSITALNRRENTHDTRVFDRLRVDLSKDSEQGFGFYSNITMDPWSYAGKSAKTTITGSNALTDTAEIELLAWGNSNYTVDHTVYTKLRGDSIGLPETKVVNGKVSSLNITSVNSNTFTVPASKIKYQFQPLRELWFDYKQEGLNFRFFPTAYQDQALTSDDPLRLSNNHIWWEESPWLDRWLPGNFNSSVNDFSKGEWDDSLSYLTRDSDGTRLTVLRGFSFSFQPQESTSLATTFASPKGLWQDYDSFDNFASATRIKHLFADNFSAGTTYTYRLGVNEGASDKKDNINHVIGVDFGYEIVNGLKLSTEAAQSFSKKDLTSPDYATKSRGNAYYFSLVGRFPRVSIMDLRYGYDDIKPDRDESVFTKFRFFAAHMDTGFDPTLSTYRETRDDTFWSRHIYFKKPFAYYFSGLYFPGLSWDDIVPNRIGNGIDIGRNVLALRLESSLWDKNLENLFDVRNVHNTKGKFVENVARDEVTYKFNEKLTTKLLGIYQKMPKTKGGIDPFIFDADTGECVNNTAIADGKDPSLKTGSLGLEYAFCDWLSLDGIWEHTNDSTMAYDNFPRGNLDGVSFTTYNKYDKTYRKEAPYLYSQGLFPLPPYSFYNIYKVGLRIIPVDKLDIYLDYTRNEFKSAGQIDDNINHIGFEASYMPSKKFGLYFKYTYSRWNDLTLMTQGYSKYYLGHHNFFGEFRYLPSVDDEFVLQYGEAGRANVYTKYTDPFSVGIPTLDTQHIIRAYYRRKF